LRGNTFTTKYLVLSTDFRELTARFSRFIVKLVYLLTFAFLLDWQMQLAVAANALCFEKHCCVVVSRTYPDNQQLDLTTGLIAEAI
jgi:hypothetical protein